MRLTVFAAAVGSAVALVGFADAANATATIDLIWDLNGSDTIADVLDGSDIRLNVILTAGPGGSQGAAVSVDYSLSGLSVVSFASTPSFPYLPWTFGTTTDTGSRVENINSFAYWNAGGTGLWAAGQSHQLGTVTFNKGADVGSGVFEITSDANGASDGVLDLAGNGITSTTTFNSAFLDDEDPCSCDFVIDINALRGGSPTVAVNSTKDITAKARIAKGTALPGTTIDTTLRIDAIDGFEVIDSQSSGPIQLEVGKGGQGDKLTMNINQCNSGSIIFEATFTPNTPFCPGCEGWRTITKTCK